MMISLDPTLSARVTRRELEVLRLVAAGHRSQDVAEMLFLSKRTVDFHLANIFEKLGAQNRIQAVRAAQSLGLIPFEPGIDARRRESGSAVSIDPMTVNRRTAAQAADGGE